MCNTQLNTKFNVFAHAWCHSRAQLTIVLSGPGPMVYLPDSGKITRVWYFYQMITSHTEGKSAGTTAQYEVILERVGRPQPQSCPPAWE